MAFSLVLIQGKIVAILTVVLNLFANKLRGIRDEIPLLEGTYVDPLQCIRFNKMFITGNKAC